MKIAEGSRYVRSFGVSVSGVAEDQFLLMLNGMSVSLMLDSKLAVTIKLLDCERNGFTCTWPLNYGLSGDEKTISVELGADGGTGLDIGNHDGIAMNAILEIEGEIKI